jgi:hypothetical protein
VDVSNGDGHEDSGPVAVETAERDAVIREAVSKLDPAEDSHWTALGAPAVAAVAEIMKDPGVTRDEITKAAPDTKR